MIRWSSDASLFPGVACLTGCVFEGPAWSGSVLLCLGMFLFLFLFLFLYALWSFKLSKFGEVGSHGSVRRMLQLNQTA